jgi:hypothetical protein
MLCNVDYYVSFQCKTAVKIVYHYVCMPSTRSFSFEQMFLACVVHERVDVVQGKLSGRLAS